MLNSLTNILHSFLAVRGFLDLLTDFKKGGSFPIQQYFFMFFASDLFYIIRGLRQGNRLMSICKISLILCERHIFSDWSHRYIYVIYEKL